MAFFYGLLIASMVLLGGSAVYALFWAAEDGQFQDMEASSKVIFDQGEPEGEITDVFPGLDPARLRAHNHVPATHLTGTTKS
ncbi:MAG: cbb3-type cytochrome oxidase assembly protein [Candidatus Methylacidiphilales bacterium]|nr:cbb3-type cytochrome oxidase assembly protein [Candidatus Methylacidiphilales bacterium]